MQAHRAENEKTCGQPILCKIWTTMVLGVLRSKGWCAQVIKTSQPPKHVATVPPNATRALASSDHDQCKLTCGCKTAVMEGDLDLNSAKRRS